MRDENGLEKCVACGLCAVACPADAIYLEPAENDGTVQAGPRYAKVYQIHKTRCIFCGILRRGLPGVGDLHGQGLRARRLQQQGLHLGQGGSAGPGAAVAARRSGRSQPALQIRRASSARSATSTAISSARARIMDGTPRCRSGFVSVTSPSDQALRTAAGAALLDQGQQRELRRDRCRGAARTTCTTCRTAGWTTSTGLRVAGLGGTLAPTMYETAGGGAAASPEERPRRPPSSPTSAGISCARRSRRARRCGRRRVPDPRGAAAVSRSGRGDRRRQDADQRGARRDEAAAAPVRPPSPVHREDREGVRSVGLDLVSGRTC